MKKVIALLLLLFTGLNQGFSQNAAKLTSGDAELDKSIHSITLYGRKSPVELRAALVSKFSLSEDDAKAYQAKAPAGDLFMVFETAKETGKTAEAILNVYNTSRKSNKGWDETLKQLGVKPGSKTFDTIKTAIVNNGID